MNQKDKSFFYQALEYMNKLDAIRGVNAKTYFGTGLIT